jgi:hypothetical protein
MTILYLVLTALGCLVISRYVLMLFFAEIGRKQDLIKHIYKSGTDFQIAVVIPYLDSRRIGAFQELIQALDKQDYPQNRIGINVVATEETAFGLPNAEDLPANVKIWTYPAKLARRGQLVTWLIERLLAAGGPSKLFVFLEAEDIVRPDFLRNVTTRAFDCFAMQGYIALKRPPKGLVSYVSALSTRVINRIENAGRFHLGLSCKLLNSGWVVRQEILEMIPFRQGQDMDNLEYTTLLNLNGYRINWAPNVVVYKDDRVDMMSLMREVAHSLLNRMRLVPQYLFPLIIQGFSRLDFNLFEQAWSLLKPPNFIIGLIAIIGAVILLANPLFPTSFYYWSIFALVYWSTQLISLAVARCSFKDVVVFIMVTPLVYTFGLFVLPFFLLTAIGEFFFQMSARPKKIRVGRRFDESQPAAAQRAEKPASGRDGGRSHQRLLPSLEAEDDDGYETEPYPVAQPPIQPISSSMRGTVSTQTAQVPAFEAIYQEQLTSDTVPLQRDLELCETSILPITNGKNAVECEIQTYREYDPAGDEVYFLVFAYKTLTFTTQKYRILDQAFYELQTKIQAKGFTIVSCGSCANFYRPTAGNAYGVAENFGFCLAGKLGKELNLNTDAVAVVTPSCEHYTDMSQRQNVLKAWQDSLEQVSLPQGS